MYWTMYGNAGLQEYRRQRGNEQEAAYNMGRAAQQLGIMHLALDFYQKVLDTPPPDTATGLLGKGKRGRPAASLDLTREAAHNMALIYRASGADELAKEVLRKYFTV
jgi:general transcription factor 3C polypeptide 3 (transcription factor C subunit 4)